MAVEIEQRADDADPPASAGVGGVLDWLQSHRYLSDERFLESRVHVRATKFGDLRIRQELKLHGLALGGDLAQSLRDSELQRACDVRARKFAAPPHDPAAHALQTRFLAGRGFSAEIIRRALRLATQSATPAPGPDRSAD